MSNPAKKFQDEMKKLGLAVTIKVGGREAIVVTQWTCPDCGGERNVSTENKSGVPCEDCGSEKSAVLK